MLHADGYDVIVLSSGHPATDQRVFDKLAVSLTGHYARVCVVAPHDRDEERRGVFISALPPYRNRWQRFLWYPILAFLRAQQLRTRLVILEDAELLPWVPLARLVTGWRILYDAHEDFPALLLTRHWIPRGWRRPAQRALAALEGLCARACHGVISVTDTLLAHFRHPRKVALYNLPSSSFVAAAADAALPVARRKYDLVHLGTLAEEGRLEYLIAMFRAVLTRRPAARALIIGVRADQRECLLRRFGLQQATILGKVPYAQIACMLGQCRVGINIQPIVHPHLTCAVPVKVFEYMAAGCSVVTHAMPEVHRLCDDETAAHLTTVDTPEVSAFADAVCRVLDEPEAMADRQVALQALSADRWNWAAEEAKLVTFCDMILGERMMASEEALMPAVADAHRAPSPDCAELLPDALDDDLPATPPVPVHTAELPFVSVIIPVRNEEPYIARCLQSLWETRYPSDRWEIIVVDGISRDGTRMQIARVAPHSPVPLIVLDNPRGTIPAALNIAIRRARGSFIIRADAHAEYGEDYIMRCVEVSEAYYADNVGGPIVTRPSHASSMARAIAQVLSHPFGVGNSAFRVGAEAGEVDTVPFGCFRAEVFDRVGLFDERLHRNEDYVMNRRIRQTGGMVVIDPRLTSTYFSRATLRGLLAQAWHNGFWNAISHYLYPATACARHVIPLVAPVGVLTAVMTLGIWQTSGLPWWGWPAAALSWVGCALYILLMMVASVQLARRGGWGVLPYAILIFPTLHLVYGTGIACGWINVLIRRFPWNWEDERQSATPRAARVTLL